MKPLDNMSYLTKIFQTPLVIQHAHENLSYVDRAQSGNILLKLHRNSCHQGESSEVAVDTHLYNSPVHYIVSNRFLQIQDTQNVVRQHQLSHSPS